MVKDLNSVYYQHIIGGSSHFYKWNLYQLNDKELKTLNECSEMNRRFCEILRVRIQKQQETKLRLPEM